MDTLRSIKRIQMVLSGIHASQGFGPESWWALLGRARGSSSGIAVFVCVLRAMDFEFSYCLTQGTWIF